MYNIKKFIFIKLSAGMSNGISVPHILYLVAYFKILVGDASMLT